MHILIAALLLAHISALAQPQLGFKDMFIGQDSEYFHNNKQFICTTDPKRASGDEMCSVHPGVVSTIANAPATAVFVQIYSGQVHDINVMFKSADFDSVSSALLEKYGAATSRSSETISTSSGVKYENQIIEWKFESGTISVR